MILGSLKSEWNLKLSYHEFGDLFLQCVQKGNPKEMTNTFTNKYSKKKTKAFNGRFTVRLH